ncbi:ysine decarboxylase-like protein [Leishmania major strain Friedlin]|uniref:Ysine decarboxylase-like protein n=1 Tax=Leishmania major TaxID=5664 RepID=Q4QEB2_LEIMA|nr:ysine decarboxylase-like protein [Leishmania major strain Friedlin]CAG9572311.1 lysine_decarboxylase-like_protein [Leishmania major strain Friedlin]CAJ03672.1 ysine decarboxylase-like protein [Leishmania major strain Friedlin]|eukprot:XP_001682336.1 ysine decarboxylase-like protein [Leishmania major strain Friedlin]
MVVAAVFTIKLRDSEAEQQFLDAFAPLQQHSVRNEPGTLTYELHQVFEHGQPVPLQYLVLERYSSMRDFEEIHLKSAPLQNLFNVVAGIAVEEQKLTVYSNVASQPALDSRPQSWSEKDIDDPLLQKGVLVFAGARSGSRPAYTQEAKALAKYIVEEAKQPVLYGGGTVGVMGELAKEAHALNGKIISIIPNALSEREVSGAMIGDRIYTTATMSERKSIMFAHANTVVALPGGVGTFDELLEVITLFQLNAYRPKIGIVNVEGFFDPFVALLRHLIAEGFLEENVFDFLVIAPTAVEVMETLKSFVPPPSPASTLIWTSRP